MQPFRLIAKHWDNLIYELYELPITSVLISFSMVDYNVVSVDSTNCIISVKIGFIDKYADTGITFEKYFKIITSNMKNSNIEIQRKKLRQMEVSDLANYYKLTHEQEFNNKETINNIWNTLQRFMEYAFYFNLLHRIEIVLHNIDVVNDMNMPYEETMKNLKEMSGQTLGSLGSDFTFTHDHESVEKVIRNACDKATQFILKTIKNDPHLSTSLKFTHKEIFDKIKDQPSFMSALLKMKNH